MVNIKELNPMKSMKSLASKKKLSEVVESMSKMQMGLENPDANPSHVSKPQRLAFQTHYKYDRDLKKYVMIEKQS